MSAAGTETSGKYVSSVDIVLGAIVITYGNEANAKINTLTLGITPYETLDQSVAWKCGNAAAPANTQPLGTSGGGTAATPDGGTLATAALEKYLPKACRA